jgi:hypothetical protein
MVDITDPVETIVSILKNGSTGLGTSGYEVTDDNAAAVSILVTFKLSEEELKEVFGGSQDYDVVLTVEKGEVKDDWLGLSTKEWVVPVIITIHVIDKFSAVGSGHKYITAPLVRSKVENALRNFIKDHVTSAGGSIHIWTSKTWKNEEDRTVRPVLYKCIATSETWTYYDPPAVYAIQLSSREYDNSTTNLGTVTITRGGETLPKSLNLPEGTFLLNHTPPSGHGFVKWETTGLVTAGDSTLKQTTLVVSGPGTVKAVYANSISGKFVRKLKLIANGEWETPGLFDDLTLVAGSELLTNGGFENSFVGWVYGGTVSISSDVHSGTKSASISWSAGSGYGYVEQVVETATKISSFILWRKGTAESTGTIIQIYYTDGTVTSITISGSGAWTEFELAPYLED